MSTTAVLEALHEIYAEHDALTPGLVVEAAADPQHRLHDRFEWDDRIAGEQHRLTQAAALIRSVKIRYEAAPDRPRDLRAFVVVHGQDPHRSTYVPTERAMADDFSRELVLRNARREWESFKRRYEHLAEFAEIVRDGVKGVAS